jgi:hypothetical protein
MADDALTAAHFVPRVSLLSPAVGVRRINACDLGEQRLPKAAASDCQTAPLRSDRFLLFGLV